MEQSFFDKEDKKEEPPIVQPDKIATEEDGVVYVTNDDGTQADLSDRTYVSVDLPEEDTEADTSATDKDS